jgi:hypothetical protein
MPQPFQFTQAPNNPYASSIADLMLRGPEAQGQAALAAANAKARALEIGGQGSAQIAGTIGQTIGDVFNLPARLQQARIAQAQQAQAMQLQALKIQEAQGSLTDSAEARAEKVRNDRADQRAQLGFVLFKNAKTPESVDAILNIGMQRGLITQDEASTARADAQARPGKVPSLATDWLSGSTWGRAMLDAEKIYKPGEVGVNELTGEQRAPVPEKKDDYTINGVRFNGTTNQPYGPATPPQDVEHQMITLYGKQASGQPLTPAEDAQIKGFEATKGQEPITIKTTENGKNVEKVMTKAAALKLGVFPSQPPASVIVNNAAANALGNLPPWATDDSRPTGPDANKIDPIVRMTPNGLYQAAQTYIATGQMPPTGRGNDVAAQAVRAAINAKVGAIAAASGMDEPALRAFYKTNTASLTQQQKLYDSAQSNITTADRNVAELEKYLAKLPDTGSPLFNKPLREFAQTVVGDPNMGPIGTYLTSVQNEYGKLINSANGAGTVLTDSARHEAQQLLNPNATVAQLLGSIQALKTEGNNRLLSTGEQIQRIQHRMTVGGPKASEPTEGTPGMVNGVAAVWKTVDGKKGWYAK